MRRFPYRLHQHKKLILKLIICIILFCVVIFLIQRIFSTERQVENVVTNFYQYEQKGDFANSWELFHSFMQERFSKGNYMQDKAHVFMNHFGVETFDFYIQEIVELESWKMNEDSQALSPVYRAEIVQSYDSKYGYLEIHHPIYVAEESGQWRILWDYNH
ncbi:hypothetical protein [Gracilibacillus sp. YIM 98692]|uniref:hypothetical protein n=1 Tax=Gracilibacillus sp. YIM 98692 TaxID=2663532 RepID=UPI0013D1723C|nr:hypothetical protein [Gracilibacillus sp. YIM 98692]